MLNNTNSSNLSRVPSSIPIKWQEESGSENSEESLSIEIVVENNQTPLQNQVCFD
jgi:hypothetical protein